MPVDHFYFFFLFLFNQRRKYQCNTKTVNVKKKKPLRIYCCFLFKNIFLLNCTSLTNHASPSGRLNLGLANDLLECIMPAVKFGGGGIIVYGCSSGLGLGPVSPVKGNGNVVTPKVL